jgi:F-type H+-transporting ATPase subunit b
MELLKLLSTNEIVAQIISFLILLFLLKAFAWKPMLRILDQRRENIAAELKRIEDQKLEAQKTRVEFEQKLKSIEDIAKARIQDMMGQADKDARAIKDDAHREASRIISKAEADTAYELVKAKEQIKDEVAKLVLGATEMLLEEKITEERDKKLVDEFIDRLDKA